ncbi:Eco57I restriction-modification methylase domain-containing protein [Oerskovia merdavium]|uniref:site-specific DNA-methyltransferase (adenine-specific) n=1 Tax=Oerskovia merdavium TaxID=2762227 RepID=A0ABR8TYU5_9CELL|nr:DNA methyltransferase [Oerskovia merdavium]MBD7980964.1 SAM-dependent DNA methyltransferase [Oerskovia merdavium]
MIRRTSDVTERHRSWLELVDRDGPFVAIPALKRVWPQGIGALSDPAMMALRDAKPDFDRAWDKWTTAVGAAGQDPAALDDADAAYRGARDKWVSTVLQDVAGWGSHLTWDTATLPGGRPTAKSPNHDVTVTATGALVRNGVVGALVLAVDPVTSLRQPGVDGWSAGPIDRMDALLRASQVSIGIVTDGRWWALVSAQDGVMTASGVVDAQTWIEERDTRDAFFELIAPKRFFGGAEVDRLPALFQESVTAAEEITVALGTQVRRAVELLVTAFSESALDARAAGRPDPLPANKGEVYEGAVTAMMRVVFLLFAEERSMMPQTPLFTEAYGISDELDALDQRDRDESSEALDATHHTWHRLLATSHALYTGVNTEDMRLPSYGGSLFDPKRFPFLTALDERGALAVTVSDRVMLEVLRSVQYATVSREYRRISFRDIDVEQIGYIYEGLLGYTAVEVDEVTLGLVGAEGEEPEAPLSVLDDLWEHHGDDVAAVAALRDWIKAEQSGATAKSAAQLKKLLAESDAEVLAERDRALLSITRDEDLLDQLRPYAGIIRRDLRNRPVVIQPGGLAVAETPSRANAGAHYTPKSLAQEVVLHALEPLVYQPGPHQTADRDQWKPIASYEILDLKIADIACGSGAFLVAAAEYLAGKYIEALHREGDHTKSGRDLEIYARRQVVANCLYGADINGMAVEMCKLSLWLVSLDPNQPFSFVDDKILHGNSLLGITDLDQLEALHIDPKRSKTFTGESGRAKAYSSGALFGAGSEATGVEMLDVRGVIRRAIDLRKRLATPVDENDPQRNTNAKNRLWRDYQKLVEQLSTVADGVIAAGLRLGGKPGKQLDEAYDNLRIAVDRAFTHGTADSMMLDGIIESGLTPEVETDYQRWKPLHWAVVVPDVIARGGFDAVIGNPPFLGGQKLTGAMGVDIRDWFVNVLAGMRRGSADLVAYFFLRAQELLSPHGYIGLIATNTIAQGDTRQVGLDHMTASGLTITRAIQSAAWPAESANLEFAAVWGTRAGDRGQGAWIGGRRVRSINSLLEPAGRINGNPLRLAENQGGSFIGNYVLGAGFLLSPQEANEWIGADPSNRDVLMPYLNGEDLNQRPDSSGRRWVIDFGNRSEDESRRYKLPFERVLEQVYPERMRNNRKTYRDYWWQFAEKRPKLRNRIAGLSEVLAVTIVSKSLMPMRVTTGQCLSNMLTIIVDSSFSTQAVLSSSSHQAWVIRYGSAMRSDPRYTPSDVFETFPRPEPTERLAEIGKTLDTERRYIMMEQDLGLTKLYNRINDPEIADADDADVARLRKIHVELDEAVMAAYGWGDVPLDHGFHTYRQITRWTVSPPARVEIIDRLLEENHRRAALEAEQVK